MTTENIIATLRQGAPVTSRLVREIIIHLERLDWAERSLKAALEKYGNDAGAVKLSAEETSWVCDGLEESERLKEAVRRLIYADDELFSSWSPEGENGVLEDAYRAARKAVEELI